jgi:hypothetical protein
MVEVTDICPVAARRFLGFELGIWCARAGARHGDIGARLGVTRASASQMMAGRNLPSRAVLETVLSLLGASHRTRALSEVLDIARRGVRTSGEHVGAAGWVVRDGALSLALESRASSLDVLDTTGVTPLLRSPSYDRWFRAVNGLPAPSACESWRRGAVAGCGTAVRWIVVESVLDGSRGRPMTAEQLHHLVQVSRLPHVSVRVVPDSAVSPGRVRGSFRMFRSPDWTVVCQENYVEARYFTDPILARRYECATDALLASALDDERSRDRITELAASRGGTRQDGVPG